MKQTQKLEVVIFGDVIILQKILKKKIKNFFFISSKLNAKYLKFLDKENFIYIQNNDLKNIIKLKSIIYKNKIHILVNDYYELSYENKKKISGYVKKFIIVDDHINRKHFCDILINANFLDKKSINIIKKNNPNSILLLGPKYFIMSNALKKIKSRKLKIINKIFIFFGSSDPSNLTLRILKWLTNFGKIKLNVVIGNMNRNYKKILKFAKYKNNIKLFYNLKNDEMIYLMKKNDLSIGAGGVNLMERLFLGIPSIVITNANNQDKAAKILSKKKIIYFLGKDKFISKSKISICLSKIINDLKIYNSIYFKTTKNFTSIKNENKFYNKINNLIK